MPAFNSSPDKKKQNSMLLHLMKEDSWGNMGQAPKQVSVLDKIRFSIPPCLQAENLREGQKIVMPPRVGFCH